MKKLIVLCAIALMTSLLVAPLVGCQQKPTEPQKLTLEEAGYVVGWPVPAPTYLPQGYEIQQVYVKDKTVILRISDEELEDGLQWKMGMTISWHSEGIPGGLKLPGERVKINESTGVIVDRGDHNDLWWQWRLDPGRLEMFEFKLSAIKGIPKEELVKVAESVSLPGPPPPGKSLLEAARIEFDDFVKLKAGETKSLDVTLETLKHGPGEVAYTISRVAKEYDEDKLPMPEGLDVSIEPSKFTAYPNNTYHSTITIKTTHELPSGEYVLLFDWSFEHVEKGTGWITVNVE